MIYEHMCPAAFVTQQDESMAKQVKRSRAKYAYPDWAYPSLSEFQRKKRRDLKAAKRAMRNLLFGVAYLPPTAAVAFSRAYEALKVMDELTKRGVWKGEPRL